MHKGTYEEGGEYVERGSSGGGVCAERYVKGEMCMHNAKRWESGEVHEQKDGSGDRCMCRKMGEGRGACAERWERCMCRKMGEGRGTC